MELKVKQEDKDFLELEIQGEDHTFCNLIRAYSWDVKDTEIASYNIKHPQVAEPVFCIKGKSPKKILLTVVENLKKEIKETKEKFEKLK